MKLIGRRSVLSIFFSLSLLVAGNALADRIIVRVAPPPLRHEVIIARPGPRHVWVPGFWRWNGTGHVWVGGVWQLPPEGHTRWIAGHWRHVPGGHEWIEGHWAR
jgi:hypothetical protein